VSFDSTDLKYPPATGTPELLEAIRDYYNHFYDAQITNDNIAVFAGGRPGIFATLSFLDPTIPILIEETEYTPYWDVLQLLKRDYSVVRSNASNRFRPTLDDYRTASSEAGSDQRRFLIKSNPCNPTGVTWSGDDLKDLVAFASRPNHGGLFDEAYEFFHSPEPVSALRYIDDINETDLFVVGAATKGLQVPGLRTGWVVASEQNIEIFRNYSSFGMGGVARPSQILVSQLLEIDRVSKARDAVGEFYLEQRSRYQEGLSDCEIELFTGDGGFYHWGRLPGGLTARELNDRLFAHKAAILPGPLTDLLRRGDDGPLGEFIRFSFGPILPETYDSNMAIIRAAVWPTS
jgi:aspartate/methionine/tyrosine aminotransferase